MPPDLDDAWEKTEAAFSPITGATRYMQANCDGAVNETAQPESRSQFPQAMRAASERLYRDVLVGVDVDFAGDLQGRLDDVLGGQG